MTLRFLRPEFVIKNYLKITEFHLFLHSIEIVYLSNISSITYFSARKRRHADRVLEVHSMAANQREEGGQTHQREGDGILGGPQEEIRPQR